MRLLILLLVLLTSCQRTTIPPQRGQTLRTCLSYDPNSLDPRKGADMTSQGVIRALFAGLAYLDKDLVPQLDLANSYHVSNDYKTYTFYLRDCTWSDGSPLTAKDIEESWKSALLPAYSSANTNLFFFIKNAHKAVLGNVSTDEVGVHAVDDKTLVVELENPNPNFLNIVINSVFFPVHESMRFKAPDFKNFISSGPFRLKKYILQDQIVLKKNRRYWQAEKTRLEELCYLVVKDPETTMLMFEKGEIDWLGEPIARIPLDIVPSLKAKGLLHWTEGAGTQWLFINTKKFPYTNRNIRKALAYAIDRTKIMHDIMHLDNPSPPLGLIPKVLKKERWHPWFQDNDKKRAQEYFAKGLEELGITIEQFPTITLSYSNNANFSKFIQSIQQMWAETLGISAKNECTDGPILMQKFNDSDYEIARMGWVLQYNDPGNLLDIFKFKDLRPNSTGWENPAYIHESDASYSCKGEEKWKHLEAAEKIFFEEMPSIPVVSASVAYIQKPYVKEVRTNYLFQIDFREAYIEDYTEGM